MPKVDWKVPQTEEGLQTILLWLAESQAAGDDVGIGNGLLALSHQVKWVRSDTEAGPFERSHELALEALEAFRRAGDTNGQVRALVACSAMADRESCERFLAEAERLAPGTGDENLHASVIAARARKLALSNQVQAYEMHKRALEIYRRTGNKSGQAWSLFSLSIGEGTYAEKRDNALEAASLNRELGNPAGAARGMWIALMNAEKIANLADLEDLAKLGLKDALDAENRSEERHFYNKLALISASKGQLEEAKEYHRWATDIGQSDGLTPLERWEHNVYMAKSMSSILRTQGNDEILKSFRAELRRLKASRPSA